MTYLLLDYKNGLAEEPGHTFFVQNESLTTSTLLSPAYKSINGYRNQQDNTLNHF